jgi:exopolysaccharide biosynthesis predicted pyruvyltransferase EpsI
LISLLHCSEEEIEKYERVNQKMVNMQTEFSQLAQVIRDKCTRGPFYYICNPGNWGDGLIRQGTLKFFHDIGFHYFELPLRKRGVLRLVEHYLPLILRGTLIYGGGGAWCNLWDGSVQRITRIATSYQQVIVLPSTYEKRVNFTNITFFSRDRFESMQVVPEAKFCHDMAFYFERQTAGKGTGEGYFFRVDKESSGKPPISPENVDISRQGKYLTPIGPFFDAIDRYQVIYTDRLHVAIAACLLKKELHLYPGAYFKNKAVYRSSMLGFYDNIHFHDL